MEVRFAVLEILADEIPQLNLIPPRIQRVPNNLRNRKDFAKYYSLKLMSFGPIHHGDENLQLGEDYKLLRAAEYIRSIQQTPQLLHKKIEGNIEELESLFEDVLTSLHDWEGFSSRQEKLSWMLFVDGCALLQIMMEARLYHLEFQHPDENKGVMGYKLSLAKQDALLLENQVPYLVLKLLWTHNEFALLQTMRNICVPYHCGKSTSGMNEEFKHTVVLLIEEEESPPVHLLDLQRKILLASYRHPKDPNSSSMITYRNIQELKASGIKLKSSETTWPRDISFSHGWLAAKLTLPEIVVDNTTAATFLNLIAYEMCPNFVNDFEICSFAAFMHSLIDHPEDVKALRKAGILLNSIGISDEEVVNLFNIISTDLVHDTKTYSHVRAEIEKHYRNKLKTWIALGIHIYFSNPWAVIAFFAALLALALTFVQTWFAMHPPKS